jgi:hypothetical protein
MTATVTDASALRARDTKARRVRAATSRLDAEGIEALAFEGHVSQ